jgi:hypothetical protein
VETGSAFCLNLLIETSAINMTSALTMSDLLTVNTPSDSGIGQNIVRCPKCYVPVWSHYGGSGKISAFVRVGTLDEQVKKSVKPDVHIFTRSKLPWVVIPEGELVMEEFYDYAQHWPAQSLERLQKIREIVMAERAKSAKTE